MRTQNWVGLLATMVVLVACSSNKVSELYRFQPVQSADSSKRFTYGLSVRGPGGVAERQGNGRGQASAARRNPAADFEDMRDELENYMTVVEYCTQGYFIYDETFNGIQYLLHGECQESKEDE